MTFIKEIIKLLNVALFILCFSTVLAQNDAEVDSLLERASELIYSKPDLAEKVAKMVPENQNDSKKKIEVLFILSQIDYQNTNYKSALERLYSIENLIKSLKNKSFWDVQLNFDLSKIYRDLMLSDLAQKHFQQAIEIFRSMKSPNKSLTEIYNYENALNQSLKKNYQESDLLFKKNLNTNNNIRYLSFLGLGTNYIKTHQPDSAIIYFSKIPAEAEILYTSRLVGLAESSLLKNDWILAEKYLINALNKTSTLQTQKEIYNILLQKYLSEKNIDSHEVYKLKYDSVDKQIKENLDQARNFVIKHIELDNDDFENDGNSFTIKGIFIIIFLIILSAIPVIYYYFKTQSDYKKYLQIVNEVKVDIEPIAKIEKEKQSIIPEKSEQLLLKKLDKFEQSESYLNAKLSLTVLSKQLDTNTKYLSEVVNKNKGKNFNSYINDLRINYILTKLKNEPKYSNYKVTSLAEECGYASHSTFITAFRSVTGISPASFINFLKKEKNL